MKALVVALVTALCLLALDTALESATGRIGKGARGRPHLAITPPFVPWHGGLLMIYFTNDWQ